MYSPNTHKALIAQIGEGAYADLLLQKWLGDPNGTFGFVRLADDIYNAPKVINSTHRRLTLRQSPTNGYRRSGVRKWQVVVWYLSMGYDRQQVADQLGLGLETIKQHLRYAAKEMKLDNTKITFVVAEAIRQKKIP